MLAKKGTVVLEVVLDITAVKQRLLDCSVT